MSVIVYKEESYAIVGALFDVYNHLGSGFLEIVYKDALAHELRLRDIPYEREKEFTVTYKDQILNNRFYADFVVFDKIILEVKSVENLHEKISPSASIISKFQGASWLFWQISTKTFWITEESFCSQCLHLLPSF